MRRLSKGRSVLNLFSYSGGFSIYAGIGGATRVKSVDIAQGALDLAQRNWQLNDLDPKAHEVQCANVFEYIPQETENFDIVICDPPSLAKSERHKDKAIHSYIETFSQSAKRVKPNGHLILSSCSSHISFEDFNQIIASALSKSRKRAQILRISGQGPDHPFPHASKELQYLKFVDLRIQS